MYKIFRTIVMTEFEPQNTDVMWLRPVGKGFAFYTYVNGVWELLKLMDDKGSTDPYDDEPYDFSGVGAKKLSDLEDVDIDSLTDGQILKYDGTTWKNEDDDTSTPGPNTVGTEQIIDNSVEMDDLHDDVRGKIQKTYDISDESLSMDFDVQP